MSIKTPQNNHVLSPVFISLFCSGLKQSIPRQGYWIVIPFPSPGDFPHPGIKLRSPSLQADHLSHQISLHLLTLVGEKRSTACLEKSAGKDYTCLYSLQCRAKYLIYSVNHICQVSGEGLSRYLRWQFPEPLNCSSQ